MKCPDCENDIDVVDSQRCIVCNGFGKLCDICARPTNDFDSSVCEKCDGQQHELKLDEA